MQKGINEMRALADQALAENESGAVAGQVSDQRFLDGVEQALRWATGDGSTDEIDALVERGREAGTCHHEPDLSTVSYDRDAPPNVVDVACRHCNLSGSFVLAPTDVIW